MAWPLGASGFSPSLPHSNLQQPQEHSSLQQEQEHSNLQQKQEHSNLQQQQQQRQLQHPPSQSPSIAAANDYSSLPATSPTQQHTPSVPTQGRKRKQDDSNGPSPKEEEDDGQSQSQSQAHGEGHSRLKPHPVKRACNQCRQQKLKCNIVTEPEFQACSRCAKHKLPCAIDSGFRRVEKRQKHAEMEKELEALRREVAELKQRTGGIAGPMSSSAAVGPMSSSALGPMSSSALGHMSSSAIPPMSAFPPHPPYSPVRPAANPHLGANEAAASRSLLDLAQGFEGTQYGHARHPTLHTLGQVSLSDADISDLITTYFDRYHHFLPVLTPGFAPSHYFGLHPLLHWAIITVAARHHSARPSLLQELKDPFQDFLWYTISKVPQTYHVVKALCLTAAWPLPTNSTSTDPSMMICGSMVQLAMSFGLHRPSHAQDFSRFKIVLKEDEIRDRMNTWVVVNLVAQNISTGYGMPQISRWNWFTHGLHLDRISPALVNRCNVERFIEKITRALYTMQRDEAGPVDEPSRPLTVDTYGREYDELVSTIQATKEGATPIDMLHLHIAGLHLRLTALFDNPDSPHYVEDLRRLYFAASALVHSFQKLPASQAPDHNNAEGSMFATNYMMQMLLAAGFTLLKLLNSFFAVHVDVPAGRSLLLQTITTLRHISVERNDLPQRLAEVLAQLWQSSPQGRGNAAIFDGSGTTPRKDELQLKVRCRMSMSLLFDSVWRWKDQMGASASKTLDRAVINPTIPGTGLTSSSASSTGAAATSSLQQQGGLSTQQQQQQDVGDLSALGGLPSDGQDMGLQMSDWPSDMGMGSTLPFDSVGWALDSFLDFNGINGEGFMGL